MNKDGKRGSSFYSIRTKVSGDTIQIIITKQGEGVEFVDTETIVVKSQLLKPVKARSKEKEVQVDD